MNIKIKMKELQYKKTYLLTCAASEDSNQPAWIVRQAKIQISLRIHADSSESSLSA